MRRSNAGTGTGARSRTGARGTATATAGRRIVGTPVQAKSPPAAAKKNAGGVVEVKPPAAPPVDEELRRALLQIFQWCDADEDGLLSGVEFAAAQRLIAETCCGDFDEQRASEIFDKASDGGIGGLVEETRFLDVCQELLSALKLPRRALLDALARQTSKKSSSFDRSVSDMQQALVRNVSNLPDEKVLSEPPQPVLWRTSTGQNEFPFPPGADAPGIAQLAFKTMLFLAMRTGDCTNIDADIAARMMGHRAMFKNILDLCGEIRGVCCSSSTGPATVDLFLAKSLDAEELFRVRLLGVQLSAGSLPKLTSIGGFEPSPIDHAEVPSTLWTQMQTFGMPVADLSALGQPPPQPPLLKRQVSLLADDDLQTRDLVLTAVPASRQCFQIRFQLAGGDKAIPAPQYVVLAPYLKTAQCGHARFADHKVQVSCMGTAVKPNCAEFKNFMITNIRSHHIAKFVVEHKFTSCTIRVQPRSDARSCDIVPVPNLSNEERTNTLAVAPQETTRLRKVLETKGLGRASGERDIAFAVRLGRALCNGYKYDVAATEAHVDDLPPLIWEAQRGDCSAFNAGFVYGLRVFGVPARLSLGFKYGQAVKQACGSFVAPHCEAEFFAEGIGWIPCDATLGIKRLGHQASTQLSFLEWRPATLSIDELDEVEKVFQTSGHLSQLRALRDPRLAEAGGGKPLSHKSLSTIVSEICSLKSQEAEAFTEQVMKCCGHKKTDMMPAKEFSRAAISFNCGVFRELGVGDPLTAASKAGVKFFEGGPFNGSQLSKASLRENMMVPSGIGDVMNAVGAAGGAQVDWSLHWPYGVFLCEYEFNEEPL